MSTVKEAPPNANVGSGDAPTNAKAPSGDAPVVQNVPPPCERTIRACIKKFSNLTQTLSSQLHNIRGINWRMSVMPKTYTTTEKETKKCLGFFVQCSPENPYSDNWSCKADAEMRMVSVKTGVPHFIRKANNHVYTPKETDWGFTCFMAWADVLDESRGYIKDDEVVVEVTIRPDAPKNTMTREEFIVIIDKWYNLADIQMNKGKTDLAIEANNQAIKFCKNKDEETKKRLELQKDDLMKRKMLDCISRIETGDAPAKILKPRFLRQPVTKNVSKVAAVKNPKKPQQQKPQPKSPVKEESKVAEEPPRKVANEVATPAPVVQQPILVNDTFEYSEADEQEVAPEDMSLPGSDVCECASQVSNGDLPSISSLENDVFRDEDLARLVQDLENGVNVCDFRDYISKDATESSGDDFVEVSGDFVCHSVQPDQVVESPKYDNDYDEDAVLQRLIESKCENARIIPYVQSKVINKCFSIVESLRDFATHINGAFEDTEDSSLFKPGALKCGPQCEIPGEIRAAEAAIIYNNKVMLHLAQQFILSRQPTKDSVEGHKRSLTVLAELEAREEYAEHLKMKVEEEKGIRSWTKKAVTMEKANFRELCEATAVENRELKAVTKEVGKMERTGDGLEKRNVELSKEVDELRRKLLLAEQQTHELNKTTAAADAKVKKEAKKDAARIRKLKTDRVESQKVKEEQRKNWELELKASREREAAKKEEQKALAAAIAEAEQRARAAEVAQVRLKADFVLSNLEMARRKAQAGMEQANDNRRLWAASEVPNLGFRARTEADRTLVQKNFKEWCRAVDELKSLLQVTKCDYDCAEGMINTGAKTLADVEFPERPSPKLPKTLSLSLPKVPEIKPISIPPPEIRTPAAGVIGQPRTPRTAERISHPYTPLNDSDSEQSSSPWTWPSPSVLQTSYSPSSVTWTRNDNEDKKTPASEWQTTPRRELPKSRRF